VVTAACNAAKGENAKFKLTVDGTPVGAETQLRSEDAKEYSFTASLKAGERKIGTEFTNDIYKEGEYDMNFYLHGVKVVRR
jgi:Ca-dependent carbohydrate-binding module xylan-binding